MDYLAFSELMLLLSDEDGQEIVNWNLNESALEYDPGFNDSFEMNKRRLSKIYTKSRPNKKHHVPGDDGAKTLASAPSNIKINTCNGRNCIFLEGNNITASNLIPTKLPASSLKKQDPENAPKA
jgi:hypothetical protein